MDADVCVVGAGYAGLTAARAVQRAGRSVVVLEARDRVGGRVWTQDHDGTPLDMGAAFLGPKQDRIRALASEYGVATFPTNDRGDHVLSMGGTTRTFRGTIPKLNPIVLAGLGAGMARLDRMAKRVSLDEPWLSPRAQELDVQSAEQWIALRRHVFTPLARDMTRAAVRGLFTCDPSEVSLLHVLLLIASAGSLNDLLSVHGGYQQDQLRGGSQQIADRMADELGDAVQLGCPVRAIRQHDDDVEVATDERTVRAARAVVAVPPRPASEIEYDPPLPAASAAARRRSEVGCIRKFVVVHDTPYWRDAGLSGQTIATDSPIEMTLDAGPQDGHGKLAAFAFGPYATAMDELGPDGRRALVLDEIERRLGVPPSPARHYAEVSWADEQWSRGCSMAHLPPGVLTEVGAALRAPVGRIHWAGTETSTVSHGTIDGAVRSGERAAGEIVRTL